MVFKGLHLEHSSADNLLNQWSTVAIFLCQV